LKKLFLIFALLVCSSASALELDWSGQFRTEFNLIKNYTMESGDAANNFDPGRASGHGYYVAPAGNKDAEFQTLFLKLRPKIVVNDNISIKSEFWLGDPTYGFYGSGTPYSLDQKYYNSTYNRGATITAERFWGEFVSDFGTLQIGRVPLQYGLGVNWDAGDSLWAHYESTGDAVRLVSKFGAFSFIPAAISYSTGNTIGGACAFSSAGGTISCSPLAGGGGLNDYSIQVKYENPDEDLEGGVNFIRRIGGGGQDPASGYRGVVSSGTTTTVGPSLANINSGSMNYNTWDIYAKKKLGKLSLGVEVPVVSGYVSGLSYSTWALAGEGNLKFNDTWELQTKLGHAPGQPNDAGPTPSSYKAYYFHPNYQVGLVMFNYQFANFHGPNTLNNQNANASNLVSPYDNPVTNANYLNLSGVMHADKWTFNAGVLIARANESCSGSAAYCWNTWERRMVKQNQGDQSKALGWEMDYGAAFQYDEYFNFRLDTGLYFPGQYFAYANTPAGATVDNGGTGGTTASPTGNSLSMVWALVGRIGVNF
jgi:hypothetical protein